MQIVVIEDLDQLTDYLDLTVSTLSEFYPKEMPNSFCKKGS